MTSITAPLTIDEEAVLGILAQGGSVAPIGRWEKPVKALVSRGLATAPDQFNSMITDAGRAALDAQEDQSAVGMIHAFNQAIPARDEARELVNQAVALLTRAALLSTEATGDPPLLALERWMEAARTAAKKELAKPARKEIGHGRNHNL